MPFILCFQFVLNEYKKCFKVCMRANVQGCFLHSEVRSGESSLSFRFLESLELGLVMIPFQLSKAID